MESETLPFAARLLPLPSPFSSSASIKFAAISCVDVLLHYSFRCLVDPVAAATSASAAPSVAETNRESLNFFFQSSYLIMHLLIEHVSPEAIYTHINLEFLSVHAKGYVTVTRMTVYFIRLIDWFERGGRGTSHHLDVRCRPSALCAPLNSCTYISFLQHQLYYYSPFQNISNSSCFPWLIGSTHMQY